MGFPKCLSGNLSASAGAMGLIPDPGRFPEEGHGSRSSIFVWKIPWTEETGGLHTVRGVDKEPDTIE